MEKTKSQKKNEPKKKIEFKDKNKDEFKDNKIKDNLKKISKTFINNEPKSDFKTITVSGKTSNTSNKKKDKEKENKNVNFNVLKNKENIIHKRSDSFQIKTNVIKDSLKENSKSENKNSSKNNSKSNTKNNSKSNRKNISNNNSKKTSKKNSKKSLKNITINKKDNEKNDKTEKNKNNNSQFKSRSNNILKQINKENKSNLNTEENIKNKQNNNNIIKSNNRQITTDNKNNENVLFSIKEFNLTETLNIISDIQMQFENSLKETKKPIEEIKKLIDNNINMNNYIPLSESQKNNIIDDIQKSSELRIKNYEMAFFYMKTSLDDIKYSLQNIVEQEEEKNTETIEQEKYSNNSLIDSCYSSENELEKSNENKNVNTKKDELNILKTYENENNNNKNKSKEKTIKRKLIEDTDFQEGIMLENALVIPPKSSGFNYQSVKDMTRTRSKRFCVKEHNNNVNNDNINKEKKNLHIRNKSMNGNNKNYIEIINYNNTDCNINEKNEKNTLSLTKGEIKSKEKIQKDCFIF